jgi:hypothetical protein
MYNTQEHNKFIYPYDVTTIICATSDDVSIYDVTTVKCATSDDVSTFQYAPTSLSTLILQDFCKI